MSVYWRSSAVETFVFSPFSVSLTLRFGHRDPSLFHLLRLKLRTSFHAEHKSRRQRLGGQRKFAGCVSINTSFFHVDGDLGFGIRRTPRILQNCLFLCKQKFLRNAHSHLDGGASFVSSQSDLVRQKRTGGNSWDFASQRSKGSLYVQFAYSDESPCFPLEAEYCCQAAGPDTSAMCRHGIRP